MFENNPNREASPSSLVDVRTAKNLAPFWRENARRLTDLGVAPEAAQILERCARELESVLALEGDVRLSLGDAAIISGYSVDHLGRLVNRGVIPNVGRKHKPLVRKADLPKRPQVVKQADGQYDPITDARSLRSRGKRTV